MLNLKFKIHTTNENRITFMDSTKIPVVITVVFSISSFFSIINRNTAEQSCNVTKGIAKSATVCNTSTVP